MQVFASLLLSNNLFTLNNFYGTPHPYIPYVYDRSSDPNYASTGITLSVNIWNDNGLGNYWGDYLAKYPNATEVNSTGVGSIPYIINENNTDSYPLMTNYEISTASIQLPDWTNLTLPDIIQTPIFPSPQPSTTVTPPPLLLNPRPSSTPSSTSAVPELSLLVIVPLLLFLFFVAVIVRHRKTGNL